MNTLTFSVNGKVHRVKPGGGLDLLLYLRNEAGLKGSKAGCAAGDCGSCTVLLDGELFQSCQISLASLEGRDVITIEGLADDEIAAFLRQAVVEVEAGQCGYCMSGIIVSAYWMLKKKQVSGRWPENGLSRNLCRCGAHPRILRALAIAAERLPAAPEYPRV